jgi:hypothetical protein
VVDSRRSGQYEVDKPPEPGQIPDVPSSSYARVTGEAWIAELLSQTQIAIGELKSDVKHLEGQAGDFRRDFRWTWTGLVIGFLILCGFFIAGYNRMEDKESILSTTMTKIETKVDQLLQRPPPPSVLPGQR